VMRSHSGSRGRGLDSVVVILTCSKLHIFPPGENNIKNFTHSPPLGWVGSICQIGVNWGLFGFVMALFGFVLGSFFLTIVNKDGQSLASFLEKNIFAGQEPEVRSQNPELEGADAIAMN
jgi:hypothetical protein